MVVGLNKNYKCEIGSKTRRFYDQKTFLKAFPQEKRMEIEEYIDRLWLCTTVFELYIYVTNNHGRPVTVAYDYYKV